MIHVSCTPFAPPGGAFLVVVSDLRIKDSIKSKKKKAGNGMAWFPKNWSVKDIVRAGEHVSHLKHNRGVKDGVTIWGTYKGVRVGVIKTHGQVATIFPDAQNQPNRRRKK